MTDTVTETPVGGRDALNRLSEAEDALSKVAALRKGVENA